jgi:hypothetical protein
MRLLASVATVCALLGCEAKPIVTPAPVPDSSANPSPTVPSDVSQPNDSFFPTSRRMLEEGRQTFRFETFGDEAFWGGKLKLHQAIAGDANGGVGPGVSPTTALAVGLKVDSEAIPPALADQITKGQVDLRDPETTLALLKLNAVVGVTGRFGADGRITAIGIQCALCHSTVDNSFSAGIGKRLDGWPNRDLDVGKIIALAPDLTPYTSLLQVDEATVRTVLGSWGPGKFDAELILDGKAFRPDGKSSATLLPAAFGLVGVNLATNTGWGTVTYWNAFVANLEMQGSGTFFDPRLADTSRFPVAARAGLGNVRHDVDLITPKLANLHLYQLSLSPPRPPAGSYDIAAAERGKVVFSGAGRCASCHVPPLFTEPGWNLHTPAEIGIDDFQAQRSPEGRYRTTPLRGLFARERGGFYHDGRFSTYAAVIDHYDQTFSLGLTATQKTDLGQYLKSL